MEVIVEPVLVLLPVVVVLAPDALDETTAVLTSETGTLLLAGAYIRYTQVQIVNLDGLKYLPDYPLRTEGVT